jgi:hypothetical protein
MEKPMKISAKSYAKKNDLVTRDVGGETIIVPIRDHVGDLNSIYSLNEVGTLIWELIDGEKTVNQIVEEICIVYDVRPEEAKKDTLEFVRSLEEEGLIDGKKG